MGLIYLGQGAQVIKGSLQVSCPAQHIKVAPACPRSPEVKDKDGKALPTNSFCQQRVALSTRVQTSGGDAVTDANRRVRRPIAGQVKPPGNL